MDISAPRCPFWSIQSMYHLNLCPARLYLNFQCLSIHSAPTVAHVPATLRSPWAPVFWHKDSPRTPPLLLDTDVTRCLVWSIQNMHHIILCPARLYLDFQILSVGFSLTVALAYQPHYTVSRRLPSGIRTSQGLLCWYLIPIQREDCTKPQTMNNN